ncbi:MAG TPA: DUF3311 domain-containing protein [Candidatus Cybelea sp.]|jgi:hypothetical protein|nr:DUF3311 domain-containing protein [Candidatus Cybelea sp.]
MRPTPLSTALFGRVLLAAIPFAALTVAIPLVNRIEPRIFGMPFLLGWILAWILAAPAFLWVAGKLETRP